MISVASELSSIVKLVGLMLSHVRVVPREPRLDAPLADSARDLRAATPSDDVTSAVRRMYRRLGIDPTKTRPSSEALLRRVRKGEPLPRVNSIVDVCNWCSVESRVPYGLYDLDRIRPPVELRRGHAGEAYRGIRKDQVHVGDRPVLVDQDGPFGNPTSDSARTMVTESTSKVLVVVFAPVSIDTAQLGSILECTAARCAEFTGAREVERWSAEP